MKKILIAAGAGIGMSRLLREALCMKSEIVICGNTKQIEEPLNTIYIDEAEQMAQDIISMSEIHDRDYKAPLKYTIEPDAPRLPGSFKHRSNKR